MTPLKQAEDAMRPLALGLLAAILLAGILAAWTVGAKLDGAIAAPGLVKAEGGRLAVQHREGGLVAEVRAGDGSRVMAGDVLIRLDGTALRTELGILEAQLAGLTAERLRLAAERDGAEFQSPDFSDGTLTNIEALRGSLETQRDLFLARRASYRSGQASLDRQVELIAQQIAGADAQLEGTRRQRELLGHALADAQVLLDGGLLPRSRALDLQREQARLDAEQGRLEATMAEARVRVSLVLAERVRLAEQRREQAVASLRDLNVSRIELEGRRRILSDALAGLDIRAPVSGTVLGAKDMAAGTVLRSGEPVMYLIPDGKGVVVGAQVDAARADEIHVGQDATIVPQMVTSARVPEIRAKVLRIAADSDGDPATGRRYYEVVLAVVPEGTGPAVPAILAPGLPVQVFLRTEARTLLTALLGTVSLTLVRAFRAD